MLYSALLRNIDIDLGDNPALSGDTSNRIFPRLMRYIQSYFSHGFPMDPRSAIRMDSNIDILATQGNWDPRNNRTVWGELIGNLSLVTTHPAFGGYYACDDVGSPDPIVTVPNAPQ
jgi:hypothetical protein